MISTYGLEIHSSGHEGIFHGQTSPPWHTGLAFMGAMKCCAGLGENVSTEVKVSVMDASRVVLKRDMAT